MKDIQMKNTSAAVPLLAAVTLLAAAPAGLQGQAYDVPAFQPPHADEGLGLYLAFLDDGDAPGVAATWRRTGADFDWGLRGGVFDFADAAALTFGVDLEGPLTQADEEFPLTVAWVTGAGMGVVPDRDRVLMRVPAGLTVGRSFTSSDGVTFTPYAHPRLGLDFLFREEPLDDDTDLNFDIDFGLDVDFQESWALRFGVTLGEHEAVGGGVAVETF